MGVVAAALAGSGVDVGGPRALVPGVVGEAGEGGAQALVARAAPADAAGFLALVGNGGDAGFGCELVVGLEAAADVTALGEGEPLSAIGPRTMASGGADLARGGRT